MIELPKDHEGREIPLDTEVLYDNNGVKFNVDEFKLCALPSSRTSFWTTRGVFEDEEEKCNFLPHLLHLVQPDSWEKLEDDIRRIGTDDCTWFCGYANENPVENACPDSCKFFKGDEITCRKKLADDILSRIRRLRGEGNA